MLPGNVASSFAISGAFLPPDDKVTSLVIDYERGGIALNDTSRGIDYQEWSCFVASNGQDIQVQGETGSPVTIFQQTGVSSLSLAFDQNMRPFVAYTVGTSVFLRWYDTLVANFVTTEYTGIRDPRLALDDKRVTQIANSDVIFGYIKDDKLCYRQQRDRFLTERILRTGVTANQRLRNVGMARNLRFQFELA